MEPECLTRLSTAVEDARSIAAKYLVKYRPQFLETAKRLEDSKRDAAASSGAAAITA